MVLHAQLHLEVRRVRWNHHRLVKHLSDGGSARVKYQKECGRAGVKLSWPYGTANLRGRRKTEVEARPPADALVMTLSVMVIWSVGQPPESPVSELSREFEVCNVRGGC